MNNYNTDVNASRLALSESFNVATYFVDRNVEDGRGQQLAVLCGDQQLSYAEVLNLVNRAGNVLAQKGLRKGDRIVILLPDSPNFVASFWGAIKIGAVPIPMNTLLTGEEYAFMLRDSGARALIVDGSLLEKVAPHLPSLPNLTATLAVGRNQLAFESFENLLEGASSQLTPAPTRPEDPAFWLYTSGSTGTPKGAIHQHRDMVHCFESYAKGILRITAQDRVFSASKLFFAYGLGNALYFPLGVGASTILLPERATAEKAFQVIDRYRPTLFFAVPTLYAAMFQVPDAEKQYDLSSVRCAVSAGEALPAALWEKFRERFEITILDGIGSTEMLHIFISNRLDDVKPGSSGRIVPGYEAKITAEHGNEAAPGEIGNLWVRGNSAAAGYWNRPEQTRATFVGGWTMTGDKYIGDENGYFWYCGRTDDMLKVSGMWVSPVEVENAILAFPSVAECAVVGTCDADGLTKPKAFVVPSASAPPPEQLENQLREFLRTKLAGYKMPRWFVFTESLPKTATGKIQRFKLRQS